MSLQIDVDAEGLAAFCRRSGILRLSFFGSVLREDFGPESDIDVLVEFAPDAGIALFEFVHLQRELGELLVREDFPALIERLNAILEEGSLS